MAAPAPPRPIVMARQHGHGRTNSAAASGSQNQKTPTQILAPPRSAPARLKVIIRRLPPGLTDAEFVQALGEHWKKGGERVDWLSFKQGKSSTDMSKQSRPGRAYMHLTKSEYVASLSTVVKEANFTDAKNTAGDTCLLSAPYLEFAPHGRIPTSKPRKDARQGTIDQDMEFIDFLQELTNPVARPVPLETADKEKDGAGDFVTPLVQFLRDKKANKGKEAAATKNAKQPRQESKDSKPKANSNEKTTKSKEVKETSAPAEKKTPAAAKVEKATRDAVKVLNKQAAVVQKAAQSAATTQPAKAQAAAAETVQPPTAPAERKRGKVGAEAKNLLQRDLGLGGNSGRRRRGEATAGSAATTGANGATANASSKPAQSSQPATPAPVVNTKASTDAAKAATPVTTAPASPSPAKIPTGPAASRNQPKTAQNQPNTKPTPPRQSTPTEPAAAARTVPSTQAFLKHANPSQGVTEPFLQEAFAPFGIVKKVEIDKKKGFAYIDFADTESLHKAIAASPVKVAQGQVVVLERKEGKNAQPRPRGGRGAGARGRGGRGGGNGRGDKSASAPAGPANQPAPTAPAPSGSETKT